MVYSLNTTTVWVSRTVFWGGERLIDLSWLRMDRNSQGAWKQPLLAPTVSWAVHSEYLPGHYCPAGILHGNVESWSLQPQSGSGRPLQQAWPEFTLPGTTDPVLPLVPSPGRLAQSLQVCWGWEWSQPSPQGHPRQPKDNQSSSLPPVREEENISATLLGSVAGTCKLKQQNPN